MLIKNLLVVGTTYTGKSWLSGRVAHESPRSARVFVSNNVDKSFFTTRGLKKKDTKFIAVTGTDWTVPEHYLHAQRSQWTNIWFTTYDITTEQTKEFLVSLINAVKYTGNLLLTIDEAHSYLNYRNVPREVVAFFRGARRWGVDLQLITHRYHDLSIDIRCILTLATVFRVVERHDLEVLSSEFALPPDVTEDIQGLALGEHYFVDRNSAYVSPRTKVSLPK